MKMMTSRNIPGKVAVAAAQRIKERDYWLNELAGELVRSSIPSTCEKNLAKSGKGRVEFKFSAQIFSRSMEMSNNSDPRLHIILTAGLCVLLNKYTGNMDIIIGTPIYKQKIEGEFINTLLALRNKITDGMTFKELLLQARQHIVEAIRNQNYPIEALLEKLGMQPHDDDFPLFDIVLLLENIQDKKYIRHFPFNMIFSFLRTKEWIEGQVEYNTMLYDKTAIDRIVGHFQHIMHALLAEIDAPIAEIDILTVREKEQLLFDFNRPKEEYPPGKTIHGWFAEQAEKTPDSTALVDEGKNLTYSQLNTNANQLAGVLREKKVDRDEIVGMIAARSFDMIISMLAIMKAGGAYLPIDSTYPPERKKYMLEDSCARILITNIEHENRQTSYPPGIEIIDIDQEKIYTGESINLVNINNENDLVYVIYTSGSTGKPKGVMIGHKNVVNLIIFSQKFTNIDFGKILQFHTISFDASAHEIFAALLSGGILYLVNSSILMNEQELLRLVEKNGIRTLFLPMSYLRLLFNNENSMRQIPRCIKHIQSAGEQVVVNKQTREFLQKNNVYLHNHYGPSETHVVTALTIDPAGEIPDLPPIGKPILNTDIYIMDKRLHLLPIGAPGELYIGGLQVGRGYLRNREATAEKFIPNPFNKSDRIYKSGDLARWLPDGNIEFLGRIDHQVKIRGFRVEPGEIESRLLEHQAVKEATVVAQEDKNGDKYLCAYIIAAQRKEKDAASSQESSPAENHPDAGELRRYLAGTLPDYMIPSFFVFLESFPLTPSGKIDRRNLPEAAHLIETKIDHALPRNKIEEEIAKMWLDVLDIKKVGIYDNFFELGGHSLKAIKLISAVQKNLNVKLSMTDIFRAPTIASLYEIVQGSKRTTFEEIKSQSKKEYYELSYCQERLWFLYKRDPRSPAFNISGKLTFYEKVEKNIIKEALMKIIHRHDSFRTYFKEIDKIPMQFICPEVGMDLEIVDLSSLDDEKIEIDRKQLFYKESNKIFNLETGPLFSAKIIKCHEEEFDLLLVMHHIISDGWSMEILKQEFARFYELLKRGDCYGFEPLKVQYRDYALWHNRLLMDKKAMQQAKEFWKKQLCGELIVLNLPYTYNKNGAASKASSEYRIVITGAMVRGLRAVAVKHDASLFMVLLTAFSVLSAHISGQDDIMIGIAGAGRRHEDLHDLIGFFVNTLIFRHRIEPGDKFTDLLGRVQENTLQILEYQDYPLELICSELKIEYPGIPVFFNMLNVSNNNRQYLENFESYDSETSQDGKFDLECYITEYKNAVEIRTHYYRELFDFMTIKKVMQMYLKLLEDISTDNDKIVKEFFRAKKKLTIKKD